MFVWCYGVFENRTTLYHFTALDNIDRQDRALQSKKGSYKNQGRHRKQQYHSELTGQIMLLNEPGDAQA